MKPRAVFHRALPGLALAAFASVSFAQGTPAPQEGTWSVRDFKFHTGEVLPEVKLHYRTLGAKTGEPVVVLHGTTGSGAGMLAPGFGGELFGPGQPLDAARYYIILPDAIGHGKSSKPSDGLRAKFPRYNYDDMVDGHHRLLTEHLGVKRARLVIGNSMGGMQIWIWAQKYPGDMEIAVPMAATPTEMASRNWITRRLCSASRPRARRPTSCSTRASKRPSPATRTTSSTSGTPRATTTPQRASRESARRSSPSTPPTTRETRPRPASWSARSGA